MVVNLSINVICNTICPCCCFLFVTLILLASLLLIVLFLFFFLVGTEQFVQASLPFKRLMEPLAYKSVDFVSNWKNFVGI